MTWKISPFKAYYILREADVKFCKESVSKTKKEKQETKNQQAAAEAADGNLSVEPVSNEDEDCDDRYQLQS